MATAEDDRIRNPVMAKKFAEKAVALGDATAPELTRNLAEVLKGIHEDTPAILTLRKAIEMDPSNKEFLELLQEWEKSSTPAASSRIHQTRSGVFMNLW
jgi:hypothetical protein